MYIVTQKLKFISVGYGIKSSSVHSLLIDKILDWSKFKALTDDKIKKKIFNDDFKNLTE